MREIGLRKLKATLFPLVGEAAQGKPSVITRHGRREAVVIGFEEWPKRAEAPFFARLLSAAL